MTNLEGRVILPPPRAWRRPPACAPTCEILAGVAERLGRGAHFPFADAEAVFDELRRASAGGIADYSGITYERIEARAWRVLALPDRGSSGHAAPVRRALRDAERPRAVPRRASTESPAEEPDATIRSISRPAACMAQYQSGTQTRRVEQLARLAPRAARGDASAHRAARSASATATLVTLTTRRGSSDGAREAHPRHPRGHRLRAVPLGRRRARSTA